MKEDVNQFGMTYVTQSQAIKPLNKAQCLGESLRGVKPQRGTAAAHVS